MATLRVKVVPKASRNGLVGWMGDTLKLRVTAAPERGKANAAVIALIAESLQLARKRVRLVAGETSERKIIEVDVLDDAELQRRIDKILTS
ncbi:MAG: DUF167 domain-containing protein [Gammaproteobacteria bacterium]|nr:DUF167 domain-containing protein [Gammaproteobacteria bacterium]